MPLVFLLMGAEKIILHFCSSTIKQNCFHYINAFFMHGMTGKLKKWKKLGLKNCCNPRKTRSEYFSWASFNMAEWNRGFKSDVLSSGQKMALRAFYFMDVNRTREHIKPPHYYRINFKHHLSICTGNCWFGNPIHCKGKSSNFISKDFKISVMKIATI